MKLKPQLMALEGEESELLEFFDSRYHRRIDSTCDTNTKLLRENSYTPGHGLKSET